MSGIKVLDYSNYRTYLSDKYDELKENSTSFSYRYFSNKCGYSSPNFLKLIIDGKRNLSDDSINRFSIFFKFNKQEKNYFSKLVHFNQAKSPLDKKNFAQDLLKTTVFRRLNPLSKDQFEYYAKWYHVAIRELLATKKIKLDAKEISKLLTPQISVADAEDALECLLRLNLIKRKDNRFIQTVELISTGDEVSSTAVAEHHRQMFQLASQSIDTIDRSSRDISGVTVSLSSDSINELKLMIQKFRKDVLELSEREKDKQSVYQLSIQMFPLSELEEQKC